MLDGIRVVSGTRQKQREHRHLSMSITYKNEMWQRKPDEHKRKAVICVKFVLFKTFSN